MERKKGHPKGKPHRRRKRRDLITLIFGVNLKKEHKIYWGRGERRCNFSHRREGINSSPFSHANGTGEEGRRENRACAPPERGGGKKKK